ncbi:MAG TPA: hypothetical protein VE999_05220 [Gemmataceae bacterium]|nr:hypothetical protein [Gemmataceae bacterium]
MLTWRVFLTVVGMAFGAILGVFIAELTQWLDGLLLLTLGGALVGAACSWSISAIILKAVESFREKYPPDVPFTPPPRNVLRLGLMLGVAEGVVVGATYGGILAAVCGGFLGMSLGMTAAMLSWRLRRNMSLVLLALFLGFLIEVAACLFLVFFINILANIPFLMYFFCAEVVFIFLLQLVHRYRRFRSTRQDEDFRTDET